MKSRKAQAMLVNTLLVASMLLLVRAIVGAVQIDRAPTMPPDTANTLEDGAGRRPGHVSPDAIRLAAERDPFVPGRRPGQDVVAEPVEEPSVQVAGVELIGTVATPGAGLAMLRFPAQDARLVRVGQTINGVRLDSVEPGSAQLVDANGATITLRVPKAGSR
jgi:hypothetical protein